MSCFSCSNCGSEGCSYCTPLLLKAMANGTGIAYAEMTIELDPLTPSTQVCNDSGWDLDDSTTTLHD
jgi:hypothetical protein